jgi:hypothetical protein
MVTGGSCLTEARSPHAACAVPPASATKPRGCDAQGVASPLHSSLTTCLTFDALAGKDDVATRVGITGFGRIGRMPRVRRADPPPGL